MILTIILLAILIVFFARSAKKFYSTAKQAKVSKWARSNKWTARLLLVGFNLAMALTGVSIGLLCVQMDLRLNEYAIYFGLALFSVGTIFFPSRSKSDPNIVGRYQRRQLFSLLRIGGSSLALIAFANVYMGDSGAQLISEAGVSPVVLILLATLGLVIFGAAILVLSCGLACNGYGAAAIMLLFGGGVGLIVLYIYVIRRINRSAKERQGQKEPMQADPDLLDDTLLDL